MPYISDGQLDWQDLLSSLSTGQCHPLSQQTFSSVDSKLNLDHRLALQMQPLFSFHYRME